MCLLYSLIIEHNPANLVVEARCPSAHGGARCPGTAQNAWGSSADENMFPGRCCMHNEQHPCTDLEMRVARSSRQIGIKRRGTESVV